MAHHKIVNWKYLFTIIYVFEIMFLTLTKEVNSEWNTRDYMKREHSLLKPYQGETNYKK